MRYWRQWIVALAALLLIIGVGCASEERLSLEEYGEFCAQGVVSAQTLIEPDAITWDELSRLGSRSLERLRAVEPPQLLAEFHRVSIKTIDFVVGVASEQRGDELVNPLAFGFEAVRIATQLRRAIDEIPQEVQASLRESGCL